MLCLSYGGKLNKAHSLKAPTILSTLSRPRLPPALASSSSVSAQSELQEPASVPAPPPPYAPNIETVLSYHETSRNT
ncbi:hypothetical protein GOP47_0016320 [Adiantum capillus-veneris]|uniref:Uncharacterized protein n=1 Tax=Adiantum capillus-veneris TaxID=13818 RepID=A0A9D4ZBY6_ADICA|nr:hypothetical protein GOP47_0016320 [Adiantum capillus-veneris]